MRPTARLPFVALPLALAAAAAGAPPVAPPPRPVARVAATVESSLTTAGGHVRQFAFDANPDTYFASDKNPTAADHLTLAFDRPVRLTAVAVTTGRTDGADALAAGVLEASADGKEFEELARFARGTASARPDGRPVRALRVKPGADLTHPLVVREFAVESDPPVAAFKYPVEFVVDVSDAPEMREWAEKAARVCERQYPMICDELMSDGFKPLTVIRMALRKDYKGVAAAGGGRITGSVAYFKSHADDVGAMVHETVHCVQLYRGRGNPGWLVEGVADYLRFFKYEPVRPRPLAPERARYNGSYRVTAAFLAYLVERHDPQIVTKLNAAMREGRYKDDLWKELTGKTVEELGREWQASLAR
jgi:hypothetical protein